MRRASRTALEYQLQLGTSGRAKTPTKVGTLTPFLFRFTIIIVLFVLAPTSPAKTIRVMTYNIHVGVGMHKKLDLARIAEVINKQKPDLVGG